MAKAILQSWGGYPKHQGITWRPKNIKRLEEYLVGMDSVIARGNGRSYGDASLSACMVEMQSFNQILNFNEEAGILTCDSGCLLSTILQRIVPLGYFLPVVPGTQQITVGGAIAADIHGKNHGTSGSFCNHVLSLQIMDQQGLIRECSPDKNQVLFATTCGGMGLTGIILQATLQLIKIESAYVQQKVQNINSIPEGLELFHLNDSWPYQIIWIADPTAKPSSRFGLFIQNKHALKEELPTELQKNPLRIEKKRSITIPSLPFSLVNRLSYRLLNGYYLHKHTNRSVSMLHYQQGFFQLDALNNWNNLYGKKGFVQYQSVIPAEQVVHAFTAYAEAMSASRVDSNLTVIKQFGPMVSSGLMSFPKPGFTICLDFAMKDSMIPLFRAFDQITLQAKGRVYLAKDALLEPEVFKQMYPAHKQFKEMLQPGKTYFRSYLSDRIGLTE